MARDVIGELGWHPEMMEYFGAQPGDTVDACLKILGQCDVMLLLVAWRQGWVPTVEQGGNGHDSITALEHAHARNKDKPVLALLAKESWPGNQWEDESLKRQWVKAFRDGLNRVGAFFEEDKEQGLPQFRALVRETLVKHKERILEERISASQRSAAASQERGGPALDFFASACEGLLDGTDIPILGCGLFGEGPLSSQALAKALLKQSNGETGNLSKERLSLATAAEYRERFEAPREKFLKRFRKILEQQSREAAGAPVLDLLVGIDQLKLIISTTYDRLLEDRLDQAGRKYAVVSHVLRLEEGTERSNPDKVKDGKSAEPAAGKLVILRSGAGSVPEFYKADELHVEQDEYIIYKPLGSPFLNDALDPELGVDTVVVTETDHACFLQRLQSPESGVPSPIKARLKRYPLLFLGYTMDVWQYRLTMLMFQVASRNNTRAPTLAVRVPDDPMEVVAWNSINAQIIPMDLSEFARSASAMSAASA